MTQADILIYGEENTYLKSVGEALDKIGYSSAFLPSIDNKSVDSGKICSPIAVFVDAEIITGGVVGLGKTETLLANIDAPVIYLISDPKLETARLISEKRPLGHISLPANEEQLQNAIDISLYNHLLRDKIDEKDGWIYSTLGSLNEAIIVTDTNGHVTFANPMAEALSGLSSSELSGKHIIEKLCLTDEKTGERLSAASLSLGNCNCGISTNLILTDSKKRQVPAENKTSTIKDSTGNTSGVVWAFTDQTHKREAEDKLIKLSQAVEQSPATIVITDLDGNIEYVNPKFSETTGYSYDEAMGQNPRILKTDHISSEKYKELWDKISNGEEWRGEFLNKKKSGELFWEAASISPVRNSANKITHYLAVKEDITEKKQREKELHMLSSAIEKSVNIIFLTDVKGNIEYVNNTFEEVTGYNKDEIVGTSILKMIASNVKPREYVEFEKTLKKGKSWRGSYKSKKKKGGYYWVNTLTSPIKDEMGVTTHFLSVQEDITEKKISEERIEYLASYDELTGLVNRNKFMSLMSERMAHLEDANEKGMLLIVDIDDFKILNDTLGHSIGDKYLFTIAELLKNEVKKCTHSKGCLVGRLGSDEFAFFLSGVETECGLKIAEEIRQQIEHCHEGRLPTQVTSSIGIVLFPEHGTDRKELFTKADASIFRAKELGQNTCHLYMPEDRYLEEMHSKAEWKRRILEALKKDHFEIWLQPISNLKTGETYHYEVLARMRDDDGTIVPPATFISMAEIFGLVGEIDRIITHKAMLFQVELSKTGKNISLGMNLSGKDLEDKKLLDFLREKIIETGVKPESLHFEITETAAIHDLSHAISFITALKQLGCLFSLDDFGVGFTSFVYLREMPVDYIKIDGSFVKNLHNSKNDRLFVKAITDVARGMGIKTIAEFVECEEIIPLLKEYNVDYAQGYFIGKPAPAADLLATQTQKINKAT